MGILRNVQLGDRIVDSISGFTGIVISTHNYLAGCRRITVASEVLYEGKPIGDHAFDEPNLKVIDKLILKKTHKEKQKYKLGDLAKDTITGLSGIITCISEYLSDGYYVTITPTELKDGKPADGYSIHQQRTTSIKKQKVKAPKDNLTGGPQIILGRSR